MPSLVLAALATAPCMAATDLGLEYFSRGNSFYEKTLYDSAFACYDKILSMGLHNASVYYNIGNALYRKKEIGRAILNFERASLLDPSDRDIAANLRFAYMATVDKIPPREIGFFAAAILKLHTMFSIRTQTLLFLALLYLTTLFFLVFRYAHPRFRNMSLTLCIVCGALFAMLSASFFTKIYRENTVKDAIVLVDKLNARNAPDGDQVLFSVHEGAKFTLVRKVGGWYYAALDNGVAGWIPEDEIGVVEIE